MIPDNRPQKGDFDLLRGFTKDFCTPTGLPISFFMEKKSLEESPGRQKPPGSEWMQI